MRVQQRLVPRPHGMCTGGKEEQSQQTPSAVVQDLTISWHPLPLSSLITAPSPLRTRGPSIILKKLLGYGVDRLQLFQIGVGLGLDRLLIRFILLGIAVH